MQLDAHGIEAGLRSAGFTRRTLTRQQLRDLTALAALAHGANFSVPGAGKTTVTLALHLLVAKGAKLLVVAPKNAFAAWEEGIAECLDSRDSAVHFSRLTGGLDSIREGLGSAPNLSLISYDQLIRVKPVVAHFLRTNNVHLVLDESHRMKAGELSQRGSTLLSLAPLAIRRDILSGTPMPRDIQDLRPQLDFLWPGHGIGRRVCESGHPRGALAPLYVRTTKRELGLPPVQFSFQPIKMSGPQLALYSLLRNETVARLACIPIANTNDLIRVKRSIMRLLQASSNPIMLVRSLQDEGRDAFSPDVDAVDRIFRQIIDDQDSPKIEEACRRARELVSLGRKVVLWSSFTYNVERLADKLVDIGAEFIHGGIGTGDAEDDATREARIARFNDPTSESRVLVANPAACGEGISLHRVCHDAIYIDRTYNAAHYLQSVDRIHRLGLDPETTTSVAILESVTPSFTGSIDYSVRRRMIQKLRAMSRALDDVDLTELALDEEEGEIPIEVDVTPEDIRDLIDELEDRATQPEAEVWL